MKTRNDCFNLKTIKLIKLKLMTEFSEAGKTPGLLIWRVNKFKLELVPQPCSGFYSGDSYVVLNTTQTTTPVLKHDIHFWLGSESTVDEIGTAAFKTVELDTLLQLEPVEHREVAGQESELFLSYFKYGFVLFNGGYDSGFKHVSATEYVPRLLLIENNRAAEIPCVRAAFQSGKVLILDTGLNIYQWHGCDSSPFDRNYAASLSRTIDNERNGMVVVYVIEQGDKDGEDSMFSFC